MSDETTKKKDELLRLLSDVESQAPRLEALGQDIVRSARFSRDVAAPLHDFISQVPEDRLPLDHVDRQIEGWRAWQGAARDLETTRPMVNFFVATTQVNTTTSTGMISIIAATPPPERQLQIVIEDTRSRLQQIFERLPLMDEARSSMRRLGVDSRGGNYRTPLDLLDEAGGGLERPIFQEGGPLSVLIALRECINGAISELLRRRPMQEPTPKVRDKLASLGRQCARPDFDEAHFERLAADAEMLLNELSGAKQAEMTRQQLIEFFHRGLLFLNALLNSIDENRLRSI